MIRLLQLVYILLVFTSGCTYNQSERTDNGSVNLQIFGPQAKEVFFHSSESHFAPQAVSRVSRDYWGIRVAFKQQFSYFFTVDGTTAIPDCACRELDDFGEFNCIYPTSL